MEDFKNYLLEQNKSQNTILAYIQNIENFKKWYKETKGEELKKIYRPNVLDYKSYLRNIKKTKKGQALKAETINANLSAIMKYNKYLVDNGIQQDLVLNDNDFIKIQKQHINPCKVNASDIERFRQQILENETKRDYAIATIIFYVGLRISECLNIQMADFDLTSKEIIVRNGKGGKVRTVYMNEKVIEAIKEYLKERKSDSQYLFVSRQSKKVSRSRINQIFNKYSNVLTPHGGRHYCFTNMQKKGFSLIEIAMIGGHASTRTTEIYVNPSQEEIKERINIL